MAGMGKFIAIGLVSPLAIAVAVGGQSALEPVARTSTDRATLERPSTSAPAPAVQLAAQENRSESAAALPNWEDPPEGVRRVEEASGPAPALSWSDPEANRPATTVAHSGPAPVEAPETPFAADRGHVDIAIALPEEPALPNAAEFAAPRPGFEITPSQVAAIEPLEAPVTALVEPVREAPPATIEATPLNIPEGPQAVAAVDEPAPEPTNLAGMAGGETPQSAVSQPLGEPMPSTGSVNPTRAEPPKTARPKIDAAKAARPAAAQGSPRAEPPRLRVAAKPDVPELSPSVPARPRVALPAPVNTGRGSKLRAEDRAVPTRTARLPALTKPRVVDAPAGNADLRRPVARRIPDLPARLRPDESLWDDAT